MPKTPSIKSVFGELACSGEVGTSVFVPRPASNEVAEPYEPADWEHAREAAAARLIEAAIEHDTIAHVQASGMADEFAAQLCAYGLVTDELLHRHGQPGPDDIVTIEGSGEPTLVQ